MTRELALILALLGTVSLLVKGCLMQSVEAATGRTIAVPTGGDFQAALTLPLQYPPNNFYPSSLDSVGFLNLAGRDYRLARSSPYKRAATDGRDIGVDFEALSTALARPEEKEAQAPVRRRRYKIGPNR